MQGTEENVKMKVKANTVTDVYEVDAEENGDELSLE